MLVIPWERELCFPFFTVSAIDVLRGSKKCFLQYIKLSYFSLQNPSRKLPHSIHLNVLPKKSEQTLGLDGRSQ